MRIQTVIQDHSQDRIFQTEVMKVMTMEMTAVVIEVSIEVMKDLTDPMIKMLVRLITTWYGFVFFLPKLRGVWLCGGRHGQMKV